MPAAIPFLVAAVMKATLYTVFEIAIGMAVASFAVNAYAAKEQRRKARSAYNASLTDRGVMIRSGVAPRQIVLGRAKVSGPVIFAQSTGAKQEFLHLVVCLAGHEIDAVETIYFNETALPAPNGSGFVTSGQFAKNTKDASVHTQTTSGATLTLPSPPVSVSLITYDLGGDNGVQEIAPGAYTVAGNVITLTSPPGGSRTYTVNYYTEQGTALVRIKKFLGVSAGARDLDLETESGGQWTANHLGKGIARLHIRLEFDQDVFGSIGVPNISAVCRGAKVRDSRTGTTAWTQNSALITAWWLQQQELGLRQPAGSVLDAELSPEANICDENVTLDLVGNTQKRYTTNGTLSTDGALRDNLELLVAPMAGSATFTQGRWFIKAGAYEAPALVLDESDFAPGPIETLPYAPRRELFNAVTGTYIDAASGYIERQFPTVENATYQAWDGGEQLSRDIQMPMVNEALRAQRLAKIALERMRQAETIRATFKSTAYNCKPNDTLALTLGTDGWTNKAFVVLERTYDRANADRITLTLRATAPGVWDWNYGEATTVDLAPNTSLPAPGVRPAPLTGLTATTGPDHVVKMPDGSEIVRALLEWTQSSDIWVLQGGHIEIEHKRDDALEWTANPQVPGNEVSGYASPIDRQRATLVRVRPVNTLGRKGDWTTYSLTSVTGDTTPPANVTGLTYSVSGTAVTMPFNACPDPDYDATEFHRSSWASPVEVLRVSGTSAPWTAPGPGTFTWYAKHVDRSGNFSTGTASVAVVVTGTSGGPQPDISRFALSARISPADAYALVRFNRDGTIDVRRGPSASYVASGNWFSGGSSTVGDGYWVQVVPRAGADTLSSGTANTWLQLNSDRPFGYVITANSNTILEGVFDVYIASDSGGETVVCTGVLNINAEVAV